MFLPTNLEAIGGALYFYTLQTGNWWLIDLPRRAGKEALRKGWEQAHNWRAILA